jgi:hypothetical protein
VYGSINTYQQPHLQDDASIWLFGIDVSDVFHHDDKDERFAVACVNNEFWVFHCLVFGSGSAPTAWGRYAAFLGRSTAAIANDNFHLQIYVDDTAFSCRGTIDHAATQFAIACCGRPSWVTHLRGAKRTAARR